MKKTRGLERSLENKQKGTLRTCAGTAPKHYSFRDYLREAAKRCFQDTRLFFGWGWRTLIAVTGTLAALILQHVLWPSPDRLTQSVISAGVALAAVTFVILTNLALAPFRLSREAHNDFALAKRRLTNDLETAQARVEGLELERIPRVTARPICGKRQHPGEHELLMWAALEVTNASPTLPLEDVEVRILDVVNDAEWDKVTGRRVEDIFPWHPVNVVWDLGNASPGQCKMTVPPGAPRTALIAFSNNSNGPPASFATTEGVQRVLYLGSRVEIQVSSRNSAPLDLVFYLECHPNYLGGPSAHFEFCPWDEWWNAHRPGGADS